VAATPRPQIAKNAEKRIFILSEINPAMDPAKMAQILMNYKRRDQ
jgi:hypothetical protein